MGTSCGHLILKLSAKEDRDGLKKEKNTTQKNRKGKSAQGPIGNTYSSAYGLPRDAHCYVTQTAAAPMGRL